MKLRTNNMAIILNDDPKHEIETESEPTEETEPRYTYLLRNKFICMDAETLQDYENTYKFYFELMGKWKADGILLESNGGVGDDYATFYTHDPEIADRYGFELEIVDDGY